MHFTRTRTVLIGAALIAVASSGTGYAAGKITGANVKNHSLTGADIKNRSLTNKVLAADSVVGANVKDRSLTAADLATGALRSKVTGRSAEKITSATNDSLKSLCSPGEVAVGGSAALTAGSVEGLSYFDPGGSPILDPQGVPVGWQASWYDASPQTNYFRVTAVCLAPPS
jgi:hypothetical protein